MRINEEDSRAITVVWEDHSFEARPGPARPENVFVQARARPAGQAGFGPSGWPGPVQCSSCGSLQRRNCYFLRDALFKEDFFTPDSPATLRFLDLLLAAGFLLALTFLFFAGDDRPVVDLLRLDLRLLLFPAVAILALDLLVALAPLVLERDDRRLLVRLV
ncbi:hypothetical protein HPB47_021719 [Ixodes persulcatus]|uniref:Uncharacterized protein n=1 Tax=Ixodes persulcatus TaxID=34615 RepID=A0AC60QF84_IXOPE|nr:hypothetical protein HPB47_021719 [Ixodes persulcatus]